MNNLTFRQFFDIAKANGVEITFIDKNFCHLHHRSKHIHKYINVYEIDALMSDEAFRDLYSFLNRIHN